MNDPLSTLCPKCGKSLQERVRFCPNCGKRLGAGLNLGGKMAVLLGALFLWFGADQMARQLAGPRPSSDYVSKEAQTPPENYNDPVLQRLSENAKSDPDNIEAWQALSYALQEKISSSEKPPAALIFEAIEALSQQLRLNPKDKQATRLMADLSFEQQAFSKAVEYYGKYLQLAPEDLDTRAKYASSLAFVGNFEAALRELQSVLKENPQHFHALAYLSITYAQMDNREQALESGKRALAVAPSAEAHQRFEAFLNSLRSSADSKPPSEGAPQTMDAKQQIENAIRASSIAGPKFSHAELAAGGILKLYFENFPMQGMPPFAKEKFLGPLHEILRKQPSGPSKLSALNFVDKASGQIMEELKL